MTTNEQMFQGPSTISTPPSRFRQIPTLQRIPHQNSTLPFRQTSHINFSGRPLIPKIAQQIGSNMTSPITKQLVSAQEHPYSPNPLRVDSQLPHNSNVASITPPPPPIERRNKYATVPWTIVGTDGKTKKPNVDVEEIVVRIVYHKGIYDSRLRDSMKLMDVYEEMVAELVQNLEVKLNIELAKAPVYKTVLNRYLKILKTHSAYRNNQKKITGGGNRMKCIYNVP